MEEAQHNSTVKTEIKLEIDVAEEPQQSWCHHKPVPFEGVTTECTSGTQHAVNSQSEACLKQEVLENNFDIASRSDTDSKSNPGECRKGSGNGTEHTSDISIDDAQGNHRTTKPVTWDINSGTDFCHQCVRMERMAERELRPRTTNFSEDEIRCLLEEVQRNANTLFYKSNNLVTVKRKKILWQTITHRVNAKGRTQRSIEKVKKKWSDLRLNAVRLRSKLRNILNDGGPLPEVPWWHNVVLDTLEGKCLMEGVKLTGGKELDDRQQTDEIDGADIELEPARTEDLSFDCRFHFPGVEPTLSSFPLKAGEESTADRASAVEITPSPTSTTISVSQVTSQSDSSSISQTEDSATTDRNGRTRRPQSGSLSASGSLQRVLAVKKRRLQRKCRRDTTALANAFTAKEIKRIVLDKDRIKLEMEKMRMEMEKARMEMEVIKQKVSLTKIQTTNAKLEQAKLLCSLRKAEKDLGWPPAVVELDISMPQADTHDGDTTLP